MEARTIAPLPETPDDLLRRAVHGDASALEEVARAWRARIRRWAMLELGNEALAEDACQDTFVQLIRHIHQYDPDRPFGPWLRTVVRHCCHRVARRNHKHVHEVLEEELESVPLRSVSHSPEESADLRQTTSRALAAFTELTPRQREVMHLCSQDGLTAAEAARELGLSPSTARVLMFKARQTLLAALGWSHDV